MEGKLENSDVVKPSILGVLLSHLLFAIITMALLFGTIWIIFKFSVLAGLVAVGVIFILGYLGFGELIVDTGGMLGGNIFINYFALRLTPEQVERSSFLKLFFCIDKSTIRNDNLN